MPTPVPTPETARTWVDGADGSGFDVDHLPYGVFEAPGRGPRVGVRIGRHVFDVAESASTVRPWLRGVLDVPTLNPLMAAGPGTWAEVRAWVAELLVNPGHRGRLPLLPLDGVLMHLPFAVADYVDYYASLHHATNVGRILRPGSEPLLPNWRHLPVAYHGRAGSVVVSGTAVRRPLGQRWGAGDRPTFGPTRRLDLEAELGFVVGQGLPAGESAAPADLDRHVFGVVGVNDWSARDVQAWEAQPLGPNLSKSFATSISAWVTPLEALDGARVELPPQQPEVLPYLREEPRRGYDVDVEVEIDGTVVATPSFRDTYWSPGQMLAHLTVGGAALRTGDLFASGTISGPEPHQRGCLLELSWGGRQRVAVGDGTRAFLEDGDEVVLRYSAPGRLGRVTLGEVRGAVVPARHVDV